MSPTHSGPKSINIQEVYRCRVKSSINQSVGAVWHSTCYVGKEVMLPSVGSVEKEAGLCGSAIGGGILEAIEKPPDIPKWSGSAWSMLNSSLYTSLGCQSLAISSGSKYTLKHEQK